MSPQPHNTYYAEDEEVHDVLEAAKRDNYRAAITIENPISSGAPSSEWVSFDMYVIVQEKENGPWKRVARLYKKGAKIPKVSLSGFEADENGWSALRDTLLTIGEERKKRLLLPASATSPSSASPTATQTSANSSPSSGASSTTQAPPSTSAQQPTTVATPSQQATKPLVAFASTTAPDSIKQPQP